MIPEGKLGSCNAAQDTGKKNVDTNKSRVNRVVPNITELRLKILAGIYK